MKAGRCEQIGAGYYMIHTAGRLPDWYYTPVWLSVTTNSAIHRIAPSDLLHRASGRTAGAPCGRMDRSLLFFQYLIHSLTLYIRCTDCCAPQCSSTASQPASHDPAPSSHGRPRRASHPRIASISIVDGDVPRSDFDTGHSDGFRWAEARSIPEQHQPVVLFSCFNNNHRYCYRSSRSTIHFIRKQRFIPSFFAGRLRRRRWKWLRLLQWQWRMRLWHWNATSACEKSS